MFSSRLVRTAAGGTKSPLACFARRSRRAGGSSAGGSLVHWRGIAVSAPSRQEEGSGAADAVLAEPASGAAALPPADAIPGEAVEIVAEAMPYFRPYSPVSIVCNLLETVHTTTGLPWWATVATCTLSARFCMLPVIVYTMRNGAKMAIMKPEMDAVQARFKAEQRTDPKAQERFQRDAQALMDKHKVHPLKMLLGPCVPRTLRRCPAAPVLSRARARDRRLCQAPVFISFFMATRRLAEYNTSVAAESAFWVPSLAEADPLYILPVAASISMLIIAELGGDTGNEQQAEQMAKFKTVMRVAAVGICPLVRASHPSSVLMPEF